jgi:hypothetical protein
VSCCGLKEASGSAVDFKGEVYWEFLQEEVKIHPIPRKRKENNKQMFLPNPAVDCSFYATYIYFFVSA